MKIFGGHEHRSVNPDVRRELLDKADGFSVTALMNGLARSIEFFGQPVTTYQAQDPVTHDRVVVYVPSTEAREAGYVPHMWIELKAADMITGEGCFIEVREESERLIRPALTDTGSRPEPLPVKNTKVMVARGLRIISEGQLIPFDDDGERIVA